MKLTERIFEYFSGLGGKLLAKKKEREDTERNRKRIEKAASISRELGAQRMADDEIKKLLARLVYEADVYIASVLENEGAYYDPLVIDALDTARAAVNSWKKKINETAVEKYLVLNKEQNSQSVRQVDLEAVVIPPGNKQTQNNQNDEIRDSTIMILRESIKTFLLQNGISSAADSDAAMADLSNSELLKIPGEAG